MNMTDETTKYLRDYRPTGERLREIESQIADLFGALDDIPPLQALVNAIVELQDMHPHPAATFIHYMGGHKIR